MPELTVTGLLKKAASAFPDRTAVFACGKFELTHTRLQQLVNHATVLLRTHSVGVGVVVALAFPNTVEFVILFLAVIRCRATAAPLDPAYTAEEFERYLSNSESNLLLTPQEENRAAQSAASKLNIPHLTTKLHSADSKITLSSTDIQPNLNLVLQVTNHPSDVALFLHYCGIPGLPKGVQFTQKELARAVQLNKSKYTKFDFAVIEYPLIHYERLVHELLSYLAAGAIVALPAATAAARSSASRFSADMISGNATRHTVDNVACVRYRSKVVHLYQSNDMPEGSNAPKTTKENKTRTERGGEEGGCSTKLAEEFEKLSGPKKVFYEESMIATDSFAHYRIMGEGGFGDNVACVRSKIDCPYLSNDMPEGKNAPTTTEENKTETEGGGEEDGCSVKLNEEFEKLSGPKKFSYEESNIATDSLADSRILGEGGFGDNVACVHSKVARPCWSNDMPEGKNAPKTTEETRTETERGGEEGGHSVKLTEEFEKLSGPKKFSYEELMIATADGKILGKGGFGVVYEGHIGDARTQVAVKIINSYSHQGLKEYKSEVMTLSQLRHKNLVRLLGYCHEANKFVLVYEFVGGGSLDYHLFKGRTPLTWKRRHNITLGLASALHYLHKQCHQCVIHRDIKSSNIMFDEKFEAKLGDFGLAKLVDHTRDSSTTQVKGTWGYLAPECFLTYKASKESNIYSFGMILLEIGSRRRAVDRERNPPHLVEWVWKQYGPRKLLHAVDEKLGKDFDRKEAEALTILGLRCAHPNASSRPSIEEVMAVLNSTAKPPKLPSKMPSFYV